MSGNDPKLRLRGYADRWSLTLEGPTIETASSIVALGAQGERRVALKIIKRPGDEWRSGSLTQMFRGRGMVRVLELDDGAVLLERAMPGTPLVEVVAAGGDDRATAIVADIMRAFAPDAAPPGAPTVEDWGRGFSRYRETGDQQLSRELVAKAHAIYDELCASQTTRQLLHGDLQHSNILFDGDRGWIAIDPKGVVGELEVETAPFLRNPAGAVELFNNQIVVERRLRRLCALAGLRYERALRWSFALAVLSAIWCVEDDGVVHDDNPALILAGALRPSIERAGS